MTEAGAMATTNFLSPEWHCITIAPDMQGGEPTIDSTGITVLQVASQWWNGLSLADIEENWPGINRGAVLVCCWYLARYGSRAWRWRWDDWLAMVEGPLWHDDYTCPLPPQKGDAP